MPDPKSTTAAWTRCRIGSCQRHQRCMYRPCYIPNLSEGDLAPSDAPTATGSTEKITITAADVEREVRWLREAGHTFAASLMIALWELSAATREASDAQA